MLKTVGAQDTLSSVAHLLCLPPHYPPSPLCLRHLDKPSRFSLLAREAHRPALKPRWKLSSLTPLGPSWIPPPNVPNGLASLATCLFQETRPYTHQKLRILTIAKLVMLPASQRALVSLAQDLFSATCPSYPDKSSSGILLVQTVHTVAMLVSFVVLWPDHSDSIIYPQDVSHAPTVDLSGHLCCDNCFSSLAWRNSTPSSNVPSPSTSPVKPSPYSPNALRPKGQQKTTNPAIEALKQNYTSVGLEKPRPSPTPSSRPQSSPTTPRSPLPETPQQDLTSLCRKPLSSKESPKTPSRSGSDKEVQHIEGHCISCKENLYSVASHGVKVIKIHDGSTYHSSCFKCFVCRKTFDGGLQYAVEDGKPVHVEVGLFVFFFSD